MKTTLSIQQQDLELHRFPRRNNETLQAWDAGDEYLIQHCSEQALCHNKRMLILNDSFGALSCWFSQHNDVTIVTDSFVSRQGALKNLHRNQCNKVNLLASTDPLPAEVDLVLMKIPKNNRFLLWQLNQLNNILPAGTPVIAVNKANAIHTSTLKLFEQQMGETKTSLAWKKHRLVFCHTQGSAAESVADETCWDVAEHKMRLCNKANVYSGEGLDLGARFFLDHIPSSDKPSDILDLGCGNGVLTIQAARNNPQASLTCVDESYMAVASAKRNIEHNLGETHNVSFKVNNCLDGFEARSQDLVLCNPPFHQQNAITDHIAWQMFCDAHKVLRPQGELLVIGNSHLKYPAKLSRLFGQKNVKVIATNNKFTIVSAIRNK